MCPRIFLCQHKAETFAGYFQRREFSRTCQSTAAVTGPLTLPFSDGSNVLMWCGYKQIKSFSTARPTQTIYAAPVLLPISIKVVCCYKSKQFVWVRGCFLECPRTASRGSWPQSTAIKDRNIPFVNITTLVSPLLPAHSRASNEG